MTSNLKGTKKEYREDSQLVSHMKNVKGYVILTIFTHNSTKENRLSQLKITTDDLVNG